MHFDFCYSTDRFTPFLETVSLLNDHIQQRVIVLVMSWHHVSCQPVECSRKHKRQIQRRLLLCERGNFRLTLVLSLLCFLCCFHHQPLLRSVIYSLWVIFYFNSIPNLPVNFYFQTTIQTNLLKMLWCNLWNSLSLIGEETQAAASIFQYFGDINISLIPARI